MMTWMTDGEQILLGRMVSGAGGEATVAVAPALSSADSPDFLLWEPCAWGPAVGAAPRDDDYDDDEDEDFDDDEDEDEDEDDYFPDDDEEDVDTDDDDM